MGYTTSTEIEHATQRKRESTPSPSPSYLIPPRELADACRSLRYQAVGVFFGSRLFVGALVLRGQRREGHALAGLGLHPRPGNQRESQTGGFGDD